MERMYYVSEFFNETMTSGDVIPDGKIYRTYEQAMDAFNHALAEHGRQLAKQPKHEKTLSVNVGSGYLQLWFITYAPEPTSTQNINQP